MKKTFRSDLRDMVPIGLKIPRDVLLTVDNLANRDDRSRSAMVVRLVNEGLEQRGFRRVTEDAAA